MRSQRGQSWDGSKVFVGRFSIKLFVGLGLCIFECLMNVCMILLNCALLSGMTFTRIMIQMEKRQTLC